VVLLKQIMGKIKAKNEQPRIRHPDKNILRCDSVRFFG
jgi:hypothetical protein